VSGPTLFDALRKAVAFEPQGEGAGNATVGRGTLDGRSLRVAFVENRTASGAIGAGDAERLAALLKVAALERAPLVLALDSAGAKVSEGLKALGAFRMLFRAALDYRASGAPVAALLGTNCYGGSSMLAHLAPRRLFSPGTRMAMSGPAILAAQAGMDPLDDMFRAMAEAAMSPAARAKASAANALWDPGSDVGAWLRAALAQAPVPDAQVHADLGRRLEGGPAPWPMESVRRKDLERIYAEGYEAREGQGGIVGEGRRGAPEAFIGLVGRKPVGTQRAWHFAERVWAMAAAPPARLEVFLDCATHAARLEDEKVVLSEYIVDASLALDHLARRGTQIGLTVVGQAGGGVYVALAAPAQRVASLYGAEIQVLPGAAVAAILGEARDSLPAFAEYRAAGVAEEELKLGFTP
jgi:Carboxyl transferase domain/Malonate decarboxylase gamma subunit (MdcE)